MWIFLCDQRSKHYERNFLEENGIDKQKILEKQERNKRLTIGESAMIPYVIMGIKALNSNLSALSSSFKDDLEKKFFCY